MVKEVAILLFAQGRRRRRRRRRCRFYLHYYIFKFHRAHLAIKPVWVVAT